MERPLLVYTHPKRFFFVAKDIELLRPHFRVIEHSFNSRSSFLLPWDFFRQFLALVIARMRGARIAIVHFAGHHSVLPVLLGFRTYIIVAGSDSCSFPKIGYGSFRKKWMGRSMAYSMRNAAAILPVHKSLERFLNSYSNSGSYEQGYAHFIPGTLPPSIPIAYGFDIDRWKSTVAVRNNDRILCIANGAARGNAIHFRKGIDLLEQAAVRSPHLHFTVVGTDTGSYKDAPANLTFLPVVPPDRLSKLFADHGIYVQPSIMEGFPNALCEAMLSGCIPIGSNMTSIPHIIGGAGKIIAQRDATLLLEAIEEIRALSEEQVTELRLLARQQVIGYTLGERSRRLLEILR